MPGQSVAILGSKSMVFEGDVSLDEWKVEIERD